VTVISGLLVRAPRRRDLFALDVLLAVALAATCGLAAHEFRALTALLIGAPVALRRRFPVPVLAVSLAASAGALAGGIIPDYASGSVVAVLACELYLVGTDVAARSALVAVVTAVVLGAALLVAPTDRRSPTGIAFAGLVTAVAWALGRIRRERRLHAAQVAEQRTQRAVGEERLRIARELHDVVAHSMSLIAVRAGVAGHVFDARPQEARAALRDIEAASRRALSQVRQVVEALREEDGSYDPVPGLTDLPALASDAAAGGVTVRLTLSGEDAIPEVPEAVGLSAFRIVQEALTNAVRHAAPATCTATVTVTPVEVRIRVANDGTVRPAGEGGHGLIGMRERVAAWGGEFSAGARAGEGFVVTATLPYRGADS
jgi:signal transduction histidine kinase